MPAGVLERGAWLGVDIGSTTTKFALLDPEGRILAKRYVPTRGRPIEVAGYRLSAAMAAGLESARLDTRPPLRALRWLEASSREEPSLAPAALASVEKWRANCPDVRSCAVTGPAFWQTTEIEDALALVDATLADRVTIAVIG